MTLPGEPLVDGPTALRPWRDSDARRLAEVCRDEPIVRWTRVPENYTEADANNYLGQRHEMVRDGRAAPFAIVAGPDGDLLGSIALMRFAWPHDRGEVGYLLARWARGAGHATRAVRLICGWGFAHLGLERIDLMSATENRASQAVAERSGFVREALLRSYLLTAEGRDDVVAFGLLAGDLTG